MTMSNAMTRLTIFYDSSCPLCAREMAALKNLDHNKFIKPIDLGNDDISNFPQIEAVHANTVLHAIDDEGQVLLGLDVTYRAWQLVGRGWIFAPLRWPYIKPIADRCYLYFANNRYRISYWLTGTSRCDKGCCTR